VNPDAPFLLLVNPWIHDFAAYDFWAKPLGLLYLAGILRKHGYRVCYLDCLDRFHPKMPHADPHARCGRGAYLKTPIPRPSGFGDVRRTYSRYGIRTEWFSADLAALPPPDLVLVTSQMTYWYPGVRETIGCIRSVFPEVPILLGGIYASLCTEHAAAHTGADRVLPGPGEGRILDVIAGFTGATVSPRFDPKDLDTYPYPALDLQRVVNYVPLLTTRGCPFSCAYCASGYLDPKWRSRSPESVVEEVRFWHTACGVVDFVLYDDAFLVDAPVHAVPLMEKLITTGMPLRFHTPNAVHIRHITAETARLMYRVGFKTLRLGLETADFDHREHLDRKVTAAAFGAAVSHLKQAGFRKEQIGAYLLAGLPGQTLQALESSIRLVLESGITPVPAYYSPIPHTALWGDAVQASRYDLAADPVFTNNTVLPCQKEPFCWKTITALKLRVANPKD